MTYEENHHGRSVPDQLLHYGSTDNRLGGGRVYRSKRLGNIGDIGEIRG